MCKIDVLPNCAFAVVGAGKKVGGVPFDLKEFAVEACNTSGSLRDKADRFLDIAREPSNEIIQEMRQLAPQLYEEKLKQRWFIAGLFAGVQDRQLSVFVRGFRLNPNGVPVNIPGGDYNSSNGQLIELGHTYAIVDYVNAHPHWEDIGDIPALKMLINLEIEDKPKEVGPLISILEIDQWVMVPDKTTVRWIDPGACKPNAQKKSAKPN